MHWGFFRCFCDRFILQWSENGFDRRRTSVMRLSCCLVTAVVMLAGGLALRAGDNIHCDLLVVGGNESAVAAAVQACRLGVKRVVLVNDIDWVRGGGRGGGGGGGGG